MEEKKQEVSINQYIDGKIAYYKEMINKHLGSIEALVEMKRGLVNTDEQQVEKTEDEAADTGANGAAKPDGDNHADLETTN